MGSGGAKRAVGKHEDLTTSEDVREHVPSPRADLDVEVPAGLKADVEMHVGRVGRLNVGLHDKLGVTAESMNHAVVLFATAMMLVGPMLAWLGVCLLVSPSAILTVATCGGVFLVSFVSVLVVRFTPSSRGRDGS